MPPLTMARRTEVANRLNGGESPASIANAMNIGGETVYRYKRLLVQPDGTHIPVAPQVATKVRLEREALLKISGWLQETPKLTLKEIREKLVEEDEYKTIEEVPHSTTIWRRLQEIGFQWSKPLYSDPREEGRDQIRAMCVPQSSGRRPGPHDFIEYR